MSITKLSEIQIIPKELQLIQNKIYEIRGYRVMLDFDLAKLYETETKRLKEQVRRNIERFPDDFMFQLSKDEWSELVANCDQLPKNLKHNYILPSAFTREGIAMLSGILHSPAAIQVNINIMRAFVAVVQLILNPPINETKELQNEVRELKQYIEDIFTDYNDINEDTRMQLELINETLAELQTKNKELNKPRRPIGYQHCHAAQEQKQQ
ncbi:MAG: ORF6N domain-containing protein [Dysgonamonadaceae bacterium]|nr:ORF6N domain-containing protein [Dysgonamonadaceae bacterium]